LDSSIWWQLLLQLFLIALNAVFACAEIAVISMNDNKLAQMASQGDKRAMRLAALTSQPARFLATIQVAITLSGFLGSAFAADNFASKLALWLTGLGLALPAGTIHTICVVIITILLSFFTLVFGELVPKRVAMRNAQALALGLSGLIFSISVAFKPLVSLLTASTNGVLRLMGIDPNQNDEEVSEEEIRMMVDVGNQKGVIDETEKEMIQNVFEFDDLTVGEFCTHRTDLELLWLEDDMEVWDKTITESNHTRYPICGESVDRIVGILMAKEYFRLKDKSRENVMANAVQTPQFVPEGVRADVLFRRMKAERNHFAVVLDEYGGTTGIVTMSDLLEQLVGDLDDTGTFDAPEDETPEKLDENKWRIPGAAELEDVVELLGVKLPTDEYETFGGYVFGTYGEVPEDGAQLHVETEDLIIDSDSIRDHRLERAVVIVKQRETDEAEQSA